MEEFLNDLAVKFPIVGIVLVSLGALVFIAQFVVLLTPSKTDDEKLQSLLAKPIYKKIFDLLLSFAPFQKKNGKLKQSE